MKIKTTSNREVGGKKNTTGKKHVRRKPVLNQKPRMSVRIRVSRAFRFFGKAFMPALLIVLVFILGFFTLRSDMFNLRDIRISGCQYQDAESLEDIIRLEFPENILRIDLDKARQRLEKEIWVKRVELHRVLPSSLVLRVEERAPAVLLELGDALTIADSDGIMLGIYKREFGKIDSPIFRGVAGVDMETYAEYYEENTDRIRRGIEMLAEIAVEMPQNVHDISEVDVSELNNIKIIMDNDPVEILMGDGNYLKRFKNFVGDPTKKYKELKDQGIQVAQIDLSNDGQIVYKNFDAVAREKAFRSGISINK